MKIFHKNIFFLAYLSEMQDWQKWQQKRWGQLLVLTVEALLDTPNIEQNMSWNEKKIFLNDTISVLFSDSSLKSEKCTKTHKLGIPLKFSEKRRAIIIEKITTL